ncbi:polysaccharide deacetylase family protein [Paenibacillus sp. SI8]|uniref:polysaccharide deacetylase family protein n=1 Tax=unclassified Paenibacillus TaxID=185978 RepID=UPI0034662B5D
MNTAQRLGYSDKDKLLIINADDFGMCHATNAGVQQLLVEEFISSTTVMMPCAWSKEAAVWSAAHPAYNVGVHLTFTSEWKNFKWGPVTRNANTDSLLTDEGYFPPDCLTFEQQADIGQVKAEIIQQIESAKRLGVDPTHLDNHMGSLYGLRTGRDFLEIVIDICAEYGLPLRMPRHVPGQAISSEIAQIAAQRAELADRKGVVIIDYLVDWPYAPATAGTYEEAKIRLTDALRGIQPGLSELIMHPSFVTDELKAITPHYEWRGTEFALLRDPDLRKIVADEHIHVIRWSDLRQLQRQ